MNFKKGDILRCINKIGNLDSCLIIGNLYHCTETIGDCTICIKEHDGTWSSCQFAWVERGKLDLSHIKKYPVALFLEGLK